MTRSTLDSLAEQAGRVLAPLSDIAGDAELLEIALNQLGWEIPTAVNLSAAYALDPTDLVNKLMVVVRSTPAERDDVVLMATRYADLLTAATTLIDAIAQFAQSLPAALAAAGDFVNKSKIVAELPTRLLDFLIVSAVGELSPLTAAILKLLGIFRNVHYDADPAIYQIRHERVVVRFDRIGDLFSDPRRIFVEEYGWGTATFDAEKLLDNFGLVLQLMGLRSSVRDLPRTVEERLAGRSMPEAVTDPSPQLLVELVRFVGVVTGEAGLSLHRARATSAGGTDAGIQLVPYVDGTAAVEIPLLDPIVLRIVASLELIGGVAVTLRPTGAEFKAGLLEGTGTSVSGRLGIALLRRAKPDKASQLLSLPGGTLFEVQEVGIEGGAQLDSAGTVDPYAQLGLVGGHLLITLSGADGFLKKVMPGSIESRFDVRLRWSKIHGVSLEGSGSLEVLIPVHETIGPLRLDQIRLGIATIQGGLQIVVAATGGVALGPIAASVQDIGIRGDLTFQKGNLGPVGLALGFKPPTGAGLALSGPLTGGGFLQFDDTNKQYSGLLQLGFESISLTAIGLLTTRMPDGSEGFSLLVIITATFPPIQLGFGFTLNGAGGLLGVNRTVVVETLRSGIKNRTLNAILFPQDPVRNAPQIISQLNGVFPPTPGHFVFGPMAKIGWGTPTILSIELGIALELPSPLRLIIMGRLMLTLPQEKSALVLIKMDVLGILDFDRREASVDATIYDSKIAVFAVTGDMAMRLRWGANSTFALSAGGFNPRFTPPPDFPALARIAIALATGDNPRLRLEAYLAVTSNTVQVGAHLDIYAALDLGKIIGKFSVQAYLGFDALFHFSPFSFIVEMGGGAALKRNGDDFLSVSLAITLTGPQPLHAWGTATFHFLGSHSIGFDVTIGSAPPPEQLPSADPMPELVAALTNRANWSAQLPPGESMLVALRDFDPGTDVLAHPLGRLTVRERIVPLDVDITRYGNATLSGDRRFGVTVRIGAAVVSPAPAAVKDDFAPAQFFEFSDDEKLARPSFELMQCGVSFGASGTSHGSAVTRDADYESSVIDVVRLVAVPAARYSIRDDIVTVLATLGAAARSPMAASGRSKYAGPGGAVPTVSVKPPSYTVAGKDDLGVTAGLEGDEELGYTEALERKRSWDAAHPGDAGSTQVVRRSEAIA